MRATVSGKALKSVFIDIAGILKRYDRAKVLGIETTKTSITFTVDTGSCYVRTLDIKPIADAMNMSLTVMYSNKRRCYLGYNRVLCGINDKQVQYAHADWRFYRSPVPIKKG